MLSLPCYHRVELWFSKKFNILVSVLKKVSVLKLNSSNQY